MNRPVRAVPAGGDPTSVSALQMALRIALDGTGPAVAPTALPAVSDGPGSGSTGTASAGPAPAADGPVPDEVAVLLCTSGSTGVPRQVLLTAAGLRASAEATSARLAGPGRWLLALPTDHVAGLQVLVRSALAGTEPVCLTGPFRAEAFAAAARTATADGGAAYTSLVPTQLHRVMAHPAAVRAAAGFDAVLLGGAAASPRLVAQAREQGVRVVTTYGATETSGGCVYDGRPLDGVRVALDDDGRILLAGPVLAAGYRDRPDLDRETFRTGPDPVTGTPVRWLRTGDLGAWEAGPAGDVLRVLGRADDMLVTGGVNVAPAAVERVVVDRLPAVAQVCVVGVPDPEWGQALVAVVVPQPGHEAPTLTELRAVVTDRLGPAAAPRHLLTVDALPLRGPGKIDRRGTTALADRALHGRAADPTV